LLEHPDRIDAPRRIQPGRLGKYRVEQTIDLGQLDEPVALASPQQQEEVTNCAKSFANRPARRGRLIDIARETLQIIAGDRRAARCVNRGAALDDLAPNDQHCKNRNQDGCRRDAKPDQTGGKGHLAAGR
jgi:hypothetical protein